MHNSQLNLQPKEILVKTLIFFRLFRYITLKFQENEEKSEISMHYRR